MCVCCCSLGFGCVGFAEYRYSAVFSSRAETSRKQQPKPRQPNSKQQQYDYFGAKLYKRVRVVISIKINMPKEGCCDKNQSNTINYVCIYNNLIGLTEIENNYNSLYLNKKELIYFKLPDRKLNFFKSQL